MNEARLQRDAGRRWGVPQRNALAGECGDLTLEAQMQTLRNRLKSIQASQQGFVERAAASTASLKRAPRSVVESASGVRPIARPRPRVTDRRRALLQRQARDHGLTLIGICAGLCGFWAGLTLFG